MTKLRKLKTEWNPQEHPGIIVGEIVDFLGPYEILIREGSAQLVDEQGNALPLPGTVYNCPMPGCLYHTESTILYTDHVIEAHRPKTEIKKEEPKKTTRKEKTPEERKAFAEKMAAAKAKKKAEREAQITKVETAVEGA